MGFFKKDPAKIAERNRKKEMRLLAKAAAAKARADAFDPPDEDSSESAVITATNSKGMPVTQNVNIKKRGSRQRNKRLKAIEEAIANLEAKVESLEDENAEMKAELEEWEQKRGNANMLFGTVGLSLAETFISVINITDKVHQPSMLALGESLEGIANAGLV